MVFGFTPLDPLVVLIGTVIAAYFLVRQPARLVAWLPAMLTVYVFIPFVTLLTLWQTVPLLLLARVFLNGKIKVPEQAKLLLLFLVLIFLGSSFYALLLGYDSERALIRIMYYLGLFSLFTFLFEMGRKEDCYKLLLKGFVVLGVVLSVYGLYQIVAFYSGLPLRGIVRGTSDAQVAFEGGILRINSLASEPKRLGYVMFLSSLACLFLARIEPHRALKLRFWAVFIFIMSLFTFAGSYFLAIALFIVTASVLYPTWTTKYLLAAIILFVGIQGLFPEIGLWESMVEGYERRLTEVEVGLDGMRVYRQEFFAEEYLANHPSASLFGVGLGQYFVTLYQEYGTGVGINEFGGLVPLNSTFLELVFDFGGILAVVLYAAIGVLIWKLRRAGEMFLCLGLLFLTLQSLTLLTLQFTVVFAGLGLGRLHQRGTRNSTLYDGRAHTLGPSHLGTIR